MAYDADNKVIVVFGGFGNGSHLADTWVLDVKTRSWKNMAPTNHPSPRAATSMIYVGTGGQMIIFGGFGLGHSVVSNETWSYSYDLNSWTRIETHVAPPERASYGMALDEKRRELVLFGGFTEFGYFNDVWVYDIANQDWHSKDVTGDVPAPRGAMSFVYDVKNDHFVMFGGFSDVGFYSDTWIFDPSTSSWRKQETLSGPPPLRTRMIYDESLGASVFFGGDVVTSEGHQSAPVPSDDTWSFDSSRRTWSELVTSEAPAPRSLHGIVYDRENRSVVVFGGTDSLIDDANFVGREFRDTWVLNSKADEQFLDVAIVIVPAVAAVAVGVFALARTRRLKLR
jgi:N-acetylneuraminic acid mutarotase